MSENGEIYSAGKNFTLPPALTAWTNSTSETEKYATYKYENVGQAGGKVARQIRTIFGSTRQLGTDSLDLCLTRGLIEM